MPMLLITWTVVVFLASALYHVQLFRKKDIQRFRNRIALTVVLVCILCAACIEFLLRTHGFEMPAFVDSAIFYATFFLIYGGAYGMIIGIKVKIIKAFVQVVFIACMCANLYAQVWYILPLVNVSHQCANSDTLEDKTTVIDHGLLATPNGRFWHEFIRIFFGYTTKKC